MRLYNTHMSTAYCTSCSRHTTPHERCILHTTHMLRTTHHQHLILRISFYPSWDYRIHFWAPHPTHMSTTPYTSEHHTLHIWAPHSTHLSTTFYTSPTFHTMGWLRLVGSIKLQGSFAKEPYKRDYVLQKRPVMLSVLLTVATPYRMAKIHSVP